ncbi:MAG: 4Fe-4S dicluster domain-containing protein [Chitinispirillaceae bacterium]|nr:4Fe-4S dicluster domain-containing protein [Chitinispirillaceae bacterium]
MAKQLKQGCTINGVIEFLTTGCRVYALSQTDSNYHLTSDEKWESDRHMLGPHRPVEPLKSILFPPRQGVGRLLEDAPHSSPKPAAVIGVKNCDLASLKIHDYVFRDTEPKDPYYIDLRNNTLIISCDCSRPCDVCFCTAVGDQPFPESGFDINISPLPNNQYVLESGSEKGKKALDSCSDLLEEASQDAMKARDTARKAVYKTVEEQAAVKGLDGNKNYQNAVTGSIESHLWERFAEDCVECGACNFVCCTCHCFLLADGRSATGTSERVKQWDSCLYKNFARVAGGANPRKYRAERLYNRFDKKFNFFKKVLNIYACDGCGRCIEACTGKIDIRDVLKEALDEA